MKPGRLFIPCAVVVGGISLVPLLANPAERAQYTSRVHFFIHDTTPFQLERGRRIIQQRFTDAYEGMPQFRGVRYEVVSDGNELIFSLITDEDIQAPFQKAVTDVLGQINGHVGTTGGYKVLRTNLEDAEQSNISLSVQLDKTGTRIQSISVREFPLSQLLNELGLQFRAARRTMPLLVRLKEKTPAFSYMIPSECNNYRIRDLKWGSENGPRTPPKTVEAAMQDIARLSNLSVENHRGTFIFSGDCPRVTVSRRSPNALEFFPSHWALVQEAETVPLPPLDDSPLALVPALDPKPLLPGKAYVPAAAIPAGNFE